MSKQQYDLADAGETLGRRMVLKTALGAAALFSIGAGGAGGVAYAASLSKAQRDAMTPDQVIAAMAKGNERFRSGKPCGMIIWRSSVPVSVRSIRRRWCSAASIRARRPRS